ncbi:MAG: hypothetical protein AAGD11_17170 [Planctomycetota bacterium]
MSVVDTPANGDTMNVEVLSTQAVSVRLAAQVLDGMDQRLWVLARTADTTSGQTAG